jgi:hypothetical protein
MPVEGHRQGKSIVLPRVRQRMLQHLLVPQVHPVKHPDPDAHLASATFQIGCPMDQLHNLVL